MKPFVATLITTALLAGGIQRASAGDCEWATAGKILTGVVAGAVIASAIQPAPVYSYQPATWYVPPPPVCLQPAPVVVYSAPVFVRSAPVVVFGPRPVVSVSIGHGNHFRAHHRNYR